MTQTTHENNISLEMNLAPPALTRKGFSTPLFLAVDCFADGAATDDQGNLLRPWDTNNRRVVEFSDAEAIKAAVDDGALRYSYFKELADELAAQDLQVYPIKVGLVDFDDYGTGDGQGADYDASNPDQLYVNGYTVVKAADGDFYGVAPDIARDTETYVNQDTNADSTTESVQGDALLYELAKAIEGDRRLLFIQSANPSWLDTGVPTNKLGDASGTGIIAEGLERVAFFYHDTTFGGGATDNFPSGGEQRPFKNMAYVARHLTQDLDERSGPSDLELKGVEGLSGTITDTERDQLEANQCNVGLPLPPAEMYVDPGHNAQGRPIYELLSVDWLYARISEDLQQLKIDYSSQNQKFPVSEEGQEILRNVLGGRLKQGERNEHFAPGSTTVTFPAITDDDRTNERLRATIEGRFLISARKFDITVYLDE